MSSCSTNTTCFALHFPFWKTKSLTKNYSFHQRCRRQKCCNLHCSVSPILFAEHKCASPLCFAITKLYSTLLVDTTWIFTQLLLYPHYTECPKSDINLKATLRRLKAKCKMLVKWTPADVLAGSCLHFTSIRIL